MSSATLEATPVAPVATPFQIADETFVLPQIAPFPPIGYIYLNSLLIRGHEPIVVDTNGKLFRESFLQQLWSLVDPEDVRWIFISHDDHDHTDNMLTVLEACPNATLVTTWFMHERLAATIKLPLERVRWVNDGEGFVAGGRTLQAVRPPIFDSPVTRGLFDPKTGVYWAGDAFAAPMVTPVQEAADVPEDVYREGFLVGHRLISPWHQWLDDAKYAQHLARVQSLPIQVIATAHGPVVRGEMIRRGFDLLRQLPSLDPFPEPTQRDLEALLATASSAV